MKKKRLPIKWDEFAIRNLNDIFDYIALDSVTAARHVKKSIILLVRNGFIFMPQFQFLIVSLPLAGKGLFESG